MSAWMAFVIIQGTMSGPIPIVNATPHGPAHISMDKTTEPKAKFSLDMTADDNVHWDRMTGVEANTSVNIATVSTIAFQTKELCDAAAPVLQKQIGVASVSCIQTQQ